MYVVFFYQGSCNKFFLYNLNAQYHLHDINFDINLGRGNLVCFENILLG